VKRGKTAPRNSDRSPRPTGPPIAVEALEDRFLLANRFVSGAFPFAAEELAQHPDGYWASGAGQLRLYTPDGGDALGGPISTHPGEDLGYEGVDRVASDANGNAVVAWINRSSQYARASFRLYDSSGQPKTAVTRVHDETYTTSDGSTKVDMLPDGRFVVTWATSLNNGTVYARAFASDGQAATPVIVVGAGEKPTVAALPDGGFAVVWQAYDAPSYFRFCILTRRFDGAGNPLGDTSKVADPVIGSSGDVAPACDADASGRVAVAWLRTGYSGQPPSIVMRGYDAQGVPLGAPTRVSRDIHHMQYVPWLSLDDSGRAVVAWTANDASDEGVAARQMSITGQPLGTQFTVNRFTQWDQIATAVLAQDDGFVVAWRGYGPPNPGQTEPTLGYWGQRFDETGTAAGPAITSAKFEVDGLPSSPGRQALTLTLGSPDAASFDGFEVLLVNRTTGSSVPLSNFNGSVSTDRNTFVLTKSNKQPLPDGDYLLSLGRMAFGDEAGNPMPGGFELSFHVLAGDANRDRAVGFADLSILAQNYGKTEKSFTSGDFNYDGRVGFEDLVILAQRYGMALTLPAATGASEVVEEAALTSSRNSMRGGIFGTTLEVRRPVKVVKAMRSSLATR
jgi:hypothetical protein